jgi:hypothetical protein
VALNPSAATGGAPEPPISDEELVAIEHACAKLYHRLGIAADSGFVGFIDCFSRDIVWTRPSMVMRGHEEVGAFLAEELARTRGHLTRHLYTTIVIDVIDRQAAVGRAYAMIYRDESFNGTTPAPMTDPEVVVEYHTEFKREGLEWKMSRHSAQLIFSWHAGNVSPR